MTHEQAPATRGHLSDFPDWTYLLDEIDYVYRHGSAGGSDIIAEHRRTVRDRLRAVVDADHLLV